MSKKRIETNFTEKKFTILRCKNGTKKVSLVFRITHQVGGVCVARDEKIDVTASNERTKLNDNWNIRAIYINM